MTFNILNESYQFKNGDVIAIFKVSGSDKKYIMYAVDDYEKDETKILISYLEKDVNDYDIIVPISDLNERKKIVTMVKEMIKGGI